MVQNVSRHFSIGPSDSIHDNRLRCEFTRVRKAPAVRTTAKQRKSGTGDREALFGLLPLYILHRASIEPVFSSTIVEQLRRHGLQLSARSISQVLAGLRRKAISHLHRWPRKVILKRHIGPLAEATLRSGTPRRASKHSIRRTRWLPQIDIEVFRFTPGTVRSHPLLRQP